MYTETGRKQNYQKSITLYMILETRRLDGRQRNRRHNVVREDGRIADEVWQEKVYSRGEWKKLLRRARKYHILRMPLE
jgi:hypothetical protein